MTEPDIRWNYGELIRRLGGPSGIRRALLDKGHEAPSYQVILMWSRRGRIPSPWLAPLVHLLKEQSIPLDSVLEEAIP